MLSSLTNSAVVALAGAGRRFNYRHIAATTIDARLDVRMLENGRGIGSIVSTISR